MNKLFITGIILVGSLSAKAQVLPIPPPEPASAPSAPPPAPALPNSTPVPNSSPVNYPVNIRDNQLPPNPPAPPNDEHEAHRLNKADTANGWKWANITFPDKASGLAVNYHAYVFVKRKNVIKIILRNGNNIHSNNAAYNYNGGNLIYKRYNNSLNYATTTVTKSDGNEVVSYSIRIEF